MLCRGANAANSVKYLGENVNFDFGGFDFGGEGEGASGGSFREMIHATGGAARKRSTGAVSAYDQPSGAYSAMFAREVDEWKIESTRSSGSRCSG